RQVAESNLRFPEIASPGGPVPYGADGAGRWRRDGRGVEGLMAFFPQSFSDDLHLHADIVSVVGDVVSLRKTGATWKGLCPFHGEKTTSFHVNREKGFFHCFGCGVGGDVIKFVELHEKMGFTEAVRMLATRFGLAIPEAP